MEDNEYSLPPMGGENVPFKELKPERPVVSSAQGEPSQAPPTKKPGPGKEKILIIGLAIALILVVVVLIAFVISSRSPKAEVILPSPSPSPSPMAVATSSGLPANIRERRDTLEKQINDLDLQETDLAFPAVDFKIVFK
ncbi:hypothetical protein A2160_03175 [Candidatus Beckwithbacteria bacterium RBG_13_42_9]|uniref:Uncharacterized protein n=1 Tax=Candidatus Beckwithbacteria bacterium RBG_13_42_9 TaxID=1797457 RepID=A0A1F5E7R7_9BACT|nr:MAG: hypothetical protein A2160_03175 [Candidatus Beckwithbacteria bacterium RBG_13_42_9]